MQRGPLLHGGVEGHPPVGGAAALGRRRRAPLGFRALCPLETETQRRSPSVTGGGGGASKAWTGDLTSPLRDGLASSSAFFVLCEKHL